MRTKVISISLLLAIFSISCDNELDLTSDWKDIPVIYGILSLSDTAHYIRVEKAFLDPEKDALSIARDPDSLYYDNIVVELIKENGNRYPLRRVDGNLEGYVRDTGIFAQSPNYLYKIKANEIPLSASEVLTLQVDRGDNQELVTAQTRVLPPMEFRENRPPSQIFTWNEFVPIKLSWKPNSEYTAIFDIALNIRYDERNTQTGEITSKTLEWRAVRNFQRPDDRIFVEYELLGDPFYQFIGDKLEADLPVQRAFRGIDFVITGGGEEIRDYVNLTLANSGITSSQDPPVFSNLSEGYGVFTAKSEARVTGITLGLAARDSLLFGRFTGDLGFQ